MKVGLAESGNGRSLPAEVAASVERGETSADGGSLQVRSKIWLEVDGEPVFGQGREELLRLVQKTGSINAAAKEMGIPYRKAWTYIDAMERRLAIPLVTRSKGGVGGGESSVTPQGVALLDKFDKLRRGFEETVNRRFIDLEF